MSYIGRAQINRKFKFYFRPSVRKSSGQTLFSTIAAHGSILEAKTWQAVLWQVLFPLLDNVIIQSDNASSERVSQSQVKLPRFFRVNIFLDFS